MKKRIAILVAALMFFTAVLYLGNNGISAHAETIKATNNDVKKAVKNKTVTVPLKNGNLKYKITKNDVIKIKIKNQKNDAKQENLTVKAIVYFDCKDAIAKTTAKITYAISDGKLGKNTTILSKAKICDVTELYKGVTSLYTDAEKAEIKLCYVTPSTENIKKSKYGDFIVSNVRLSIDIEDPFYVDEAVYKSFKDGEPCPELNDFTGTRGWGSNYICKKDGNGYYFVTKDIFEQYGSIENIKKQASYEGSDLPTIYYISDQNKINGKIVAKIYGYIWEKGMPGFSDVNKRQNNTIESASIVISKDAILSYLTDNGFPRNYKDMSIADYAAGKYPDDAAFVTKIPFFDYLTLTCDESGRATQLKQVYSAG